MISVIVPVYNVAPYLKVCLDSILHQNYSNYEVILVDDGSNDGSENICREYAADDNRIRLIRQENSGLSAARNAGTRVARGEYLTYVDSDDVLAQDYLVTLLYGIETTDADVAVCGSEKFWGDVPQSQFTDARFDVVDGKAACGMIVSEHISDMICVWGKLYRAKFKDLLEMPVGKYHEDEFVTYKLMYSARRVAVTRNVGYLYRKRDGSITSQKFNARRLDKLEALKAAAQWLSDKNDEFLYTSALKRYLLGIQIMWFRATECKADENIIQKLLSEYRTCYAVHGKRVKRMCSPIEKIQMNTFRLSPKLYSTMTRLYVKLFGED